MDNPVFVGKENILLVQDDYYRTSDTSRIDAETSFTAPATTEATSTLRLRQKLKRDKIVSLYRYLDVTGDPGLADLDLRSKKKSKKGNIEVIFLDGNNHWKSLTNKRTGKFLAQKTLRDKFGGLNIMKSVLSLDETPSALERSISAASKIKSELPTDMQMESIPLKQRSPLVENIHLKTREASQNTDLDMQEFLGIDKAVQSIQGELLNNTLKLTEIDKCIQRDTRRLEEVENDPTYTNEQRQLYRDRLDNLNTKKQARLEILSRKDQRDLQTQVAGIKQTIEKVFDKNTPLPERILTLIREQIVTIISALTTLLVGIATIVLSVIGDFTGADAVKRLAGKTVEALPAIMGSVIAATLGFLGKVVGFVAEHTWALIVFAVGLVGWWLMQKVKKD